jgi:hypothetical protein
MISRLENPRESGLSSVKCQWFTIKFEYGMRVICEPNRGQFMVAWPGPGGGRGRDSAGGPLPGGGDGPPRPSAVLVEVLDRVSGPDRGCAGLSDDEAFEVLGRWDAAEAWCAAAKLGVVRALIRRRPLPGFGPAQPGGLPQACQQYLTEEVALELGISKRAADALISVAWALEVPLAATAAALDAGVISLSKARIIVDATAVLTDQDAAAAEALIAGRLAGKTHGQIAQLIARAVVTVDPDGARKRREQAQRDDARVAFWREHAGTAALAGFGLPPDQALAANQHIQDTALEYRAWGVPGTLDQLRVLAFLDALNGTDARRRFPRKDPATGSPDHDPVGGAGGGTDTGPGDGHDSQPGAGPGDGTGAGPGDDLDGRPDAGPGRGRNGRPGGGAGGGPGGGGQPGGSPPGVAGLAAATNLTIPLLDLLGLAERPGEAYGLGALDPDLARQFAAAAARHPGSTWCITVTDPDGHAIGHGCAKPARRGKPPDPGHGTAGNRDGPAFAYAGPGPPGGYGTWHLSIDGIRLQVSLGPIPVTDCDHRYQSKGYQPSATLRHLVEIRDGQCTLPVCARHARRCDFEHAVPWHQGGRTCACNGGARCRHDHQIKQTPGWAVTQPRPGYHQWTTPAGRTYTTEPMRHPI